jgi:membrane-associated phospholipid phosphatase
VWVYLSQFAFLFLVLLALRKAESISRTVYSIALASGAAFLIFLIFPTEFARPQPSGAGLTGRAFACLHALDAPTNCFPSLHVALAWLAALGVADEHRRLRAAGYAWAACITLSTLTTKQHCFVDIVGGVMLALVCRSVVRRATFAPGKGGSLPA